MVEGYETIFKEINKQLGEGPDWVVVPVGIGGLVQAAVTHYKALGVKSDKVTRILAVEVESAPSLHTSLQKGEILTVEVGETIMKGLNYGTVAPAAWPILRDGLDASVVLGDAEVKAAIEELKNEGVEVGPCGGAVLAALRVVLGSEKVGQELGFGSIDTVVLVSTEGAAVG